MDFTGITVRHDQLGGEPGIRGLRIPGSTIIYMVADGMGEAEILDAYPDLESGDIKEALRYAARMVDERIIHLAPA